MQLHGRSLIIRTSLILLLFLSGIFTVSPAGADLQSELTARLQTAFPPFTGKVREISGTTLVIRQTSPKPVEPGAILKVTGKAKVRVLSVESRVLKAALEDPAKIQPGDPVSGLSRPLKAALVPLSQETLQYLLMHPLPQGEIETIRTEDVLTAMIEQGMTDFNIIRPEEMPGLRKALKVDLILQVKTIEGLGQKLLRFVPLPDAGGSSFPPFSVLLTQGTFPVAGRVTPAPLLPQAAPPMPVMIPAKPGSSNAFVPLVPEQQEPVPAPVLPAGSAASSGERPKLPDLSGFHDPAHWHRLLILNKRIMSMAAGHFTQTEQKEIIIGQPGKVQIYSLIRGKLSAGPLLENGAFSSIFWLDAWDVNGDGIDEILVDTQEGVYLLTYQNGEIRIVKREKGLALRRIGRQLLAQDLSSLEQGKGPIRNIHWSRSGWKSGGALAQADRSNLFSLVDPFAKPAVWIDTDHKLRRGDLLLSKEGCGESNSTRLLGLSFPIFGRSFAFSTDYLFFHNRPEPWPHISRSGYNNGGNVVYLAEGKKPLSSPTFRGSISDIVFDDFNGDGEGSIIISQVVKGMGGGAYLRSYGK